eukprot:2874777-Rhodomonas_salina.1
MLRNLSNHEQHVRGQQVVLTRACKHRAGNSKTNATSNKTNLLLGCSSTQGEGAETPCERPRAVPGNARNRAVRMGFIPRARHAHT